MRGEAERPTAIHDRDRWERAYPKLIHYNTLDKGGHFAAWEQPALFSTELRAAFRFLR
jgi:pimeloyl-ACP methyl ester carboxylesterase